MDRRQLSWSELKGGAMGSKVMRIGIHASQPSGPLLRPAATAEGLEWRHALRLAAFSMAAIPA